MVFSLDETCCVSSCVVLRRVAALNFIFPALTTPLSAQAFLGYDVLETTASSYLKVPIFVDDGYVTTDKTLGLERFQVVVATTSYHP